MTHNVFCLAVRVNGDDKRKQVAQRATIAHLSPVSGPSYKEQPLQVMVQNENSEWRQNSHQNQNLLVLFTKACEIKGNSVSLEASNHLSPIVCLEMHIFRLRFLMYVLMHFQRVGLVYPASVVTKMIRKIIVTIKSIRTCRYMYYKISKQLYFTASCIK